MVIRRIFSFSLLFFFINIVGVLYAASGAFAAVAAQILAGVFYLYFQFVPVKDVSPQRRMRMLRGGRELLIAAMVCFTAECVLYLLLLRRGELFGHIPALNALVCALLLFGLLANGLLRIFLSSRQLGLMPRLLLVFCWWVPVLNIVLVQKYLRISQKEYRYAVDHSRLNAERKEDMVCKTKYPLLMVHGVFFRDWKAFNYWGRIPAALEENGAVIHYGNHQSTAAVEQSAAEIRQCISDIVRETGCEKVNIIAHSKGGLDSRFAISCLGAGEHVASLTTVCTPHFGCNYVRKLLQIIPGKLISAIGRQYESVYTALGDENPDFFSGLRDLTDSECARLNAVMKDDPRVYYQSVGAMMRSASSAMFPLNVGYSLIKFFGGGDNDGLTATASMAWENFLGVLQPGSKQGISHGDMIDLTRKDIEGFDVCEFYVDLVSRLRQNGF